MGRLNASGLWHAGAAVLALQLCGTAVAASNSPNSVAAMSIAGELFAGAILTGAVVFLAMAGFLFLKGSYGAKRAQARFAEEAAALSRQLEVAQSIMTAEPQALVVCDKDETPRLVTHTLSASSGAPAKLAMLMRFGSWVERDAAAILDARLKKLREDGAPFWLVVKTLSGATIEAEGRASGACYYVKFRDLAERRLELTNLMSQIRTQNDELASQTALLDALPLPVWFRAADGRLKWVNKAYAASVEATNPQEVVDSQIELLEARQRAKVQFETVKGDVFRSRLQTVVSGERRTFETVVAPAGQGSAGAAIDLAPLETAKDKLSRHMAAHSRTLDRVATAVSIFGPDQRLVFYNQAYLEFWGIEAEWLDTKPKLGEILDRLRQSRQLPEQRNYRTWRAEQLKAYESAEGHEDCWHLPDGRSVLVVIDQRPDGGVTLLHDDVTEKFALESRYNALIHVQRETLDHLREGVAVFGSDARLRLFNPVFVAMWQLNAAVLERAPHIEEVALICRTPNNEEDPWVSAKLAVTNVNDKRQSFDGYLNRADGSVIAYAGVPLPDGGTLLTYIDITDRKRVEQALIERNEALEAADRLKNAFISHVSRELRTPLTNIIGFSELLASQHFGPLNPKQREYMNDISSSSVALLSIINDILDLAVIDAGALELTLAPVSLQDVIDAAELGVRDRLVKSGLQLEIQVAPEVGQIMADGQRLTQILFNLLSNAIGFSEEGSVITLNCRRESGRIAFTVQDMGCGIPEEFQKAVFERFESRTLGSGHRGAGLGLSLVKSLVEMHGGEIRLRSSPGAGTTVTVLMPDGGPKRYSHIATEAKETARASQRTISAIFSS
ncbi:MAG: PAS-domain containing protein [Chitinophagales bacterium]|nr:PAS-domain containing protein [Hyphomicrobiales bacterium]